MNPNNKTKSTLDYALVLETSACKTARTKCSPPLDVRSTVSKPSAQYTTIIIFAATSNSPIPGATTTPVDTTDALKKIISGFTEELPFLIATISYEPETVLLQLEDLNQELINAADIYKAAMPHQKIPSARD